MGGSFITGHTLTSSRGAAPDVRSRLAALMLLVSLTACRLPLAQDDETLVSSLRFSPSAFDSFRRNTELKYNLRTPASVSIFIVKKDSSRELLVKTLAVGLAETKGAHAVTWLGDTDERLFAPSGTYVGVLLAGGRRFETTVQVFHF